MKKQFLVGGSITAVVLVVLASFTSVVGYSSVKDSEIIDSPLFMIRTNRINNKEETLTNNYIGKGKDASNMHFQRNSNTIKLSKIFDIIKEMDDKSFNRFLNMIYDQVKDNNEIHGNKYLQLKTLFETLRSNLNNALIYNDLEKPLPITTDFWLPGCYLSELMFAIFIIILYILMRSQTLNLACGPW